MKTESYLVTVDVKAVGYQICRVKARSYGEALAKFHDDIFEVLDEEFEVTHTKNPKVSLEK